ncbi:peptide chain release factor-like protein [endosymbiont of Pachyrhynchus infernalis]|uniref:peptide chain release factor-like protein n=1 Tax=endosymbiont of Pachyrhynchus infernalis TaxID=1971488 RepID=UPI000DC6DC17|nr:PCRF domain-containing protein [endosymbiont of Pachyrhynchus infernalis]BBA84755.1 peptide chain release factor 2 [endosymbiont of Pachyrhynchus infernalis]
MNKYNDFFTNSDDISCFISIISGSGGIESQDWVNILFRMYIKWIKIKNLKYKILSEDKFFIKRKKSVLIYVEGKYAYGWLKTENGIHRLVRKSPFDSGKRHTSFSSVYIKKNIDENLDVNLNNNDIKFSFCKSSGNGGQHINKTNSAVRVFHIPTGINVKSNDSKYQNINKKNALKRLKNKIYNIKLNNKIKNNKKIEDLKSDISWGRQIRSYILDDSIIKDNLTGLETNNIKEVLNGNLSIFIEKCLKNKLYK